MIPHSTFQTEESTKISIDPCTGFLYWLTSTDIKIIKMCTLGERRHRLALGLAMLIPIIMGFEAGFYAGGILSDHNTVVSYLLAFTIAAMVTFMEKVVTAGIEGSKITTAVRIRIGIGFIWASLLSPIVTISWFADAIDAQIFTKEQLVKDRINEKHNTERIEQLNRLIPEARILEETRIDMVEEADGTGGSGYRDMGSIYKLKEEQYKYKLDQFAALKAEVDTKVADIESERRQKLSSSGSEVAKGLLGRVNTLILIADKNWYVSFLLLCTFLFLFSVEVLAIMAKLDYNSKPTNIYNSIIKSRSGEILNNDERMKETRCVLEMQPVILERKTRELALERELMQRQSAHDLAMAALQGNRLLELARGKATFEADLRSALANDNAELYKTLVAQYDRFTRIYPDNIAPTDAFVYSGTVVQDWEEKIEAPFAVSQSMVAACKEILAPLPQHASVIEIARAIYKWIQCNINYSVDLFDGKLTALECFNNRAGTTVAMSCLFVAMAKVCNLDEATMVNIDIDVKDEDVEHMCANFFNGIRYVLVDFAGDTFDANHSAFETWPEARVIAYFDKKRYSMAS